MFDKANYLEISYVYGIYEVLLLAGFYNYFWFAKVTETLAGGC